jgi:hypothetical protein
MEAGRGGQGLMGKVVLATVLTFLAVPVIGALLGLVQLAVYRLRVRAGKMTADEIPFFGALLMRGMMIVVALGVIAAITANVRSGPG